MNRLREQESVENPYGENEVGNARPTRRDVLCVIAGLRHKAWHKPL
jgi:hypothetical protein